jgi:hypothetical protein
LLKSGKGEPRLAPILHKTEILGRGLDYRDNLAATFGAELHFACCQSKQRVVVTATHIVSGVEVSATLANQDFSGLDNLSTETLDA